MAEQKLPDKAQENEMKREKVRVVPIKYIDDSPDHPFQVRDDEEMMSLVESIATFGVITPVIARKTADERYELISGHRRKRACELLHIDSLPSPHNKMWVCIHDDKSITYPPYHTWGGAMAFHHSKLRNKRVVLKVD